MFVDCMLIGGVEDQVPSAEGGGFHQRAWFENATMLFRQCRTLRNSAETLEEESPTNRPAGVVEVRGVLR